MLDKTIFGILILLCLPLCIASFTDKVIVHAKEKPNKPDYQVVTLTTYTVDIRQTDDTPTETASGFVVDSLNPGRHRIIAVSHDLKRSLKWGSKVKISNAGRFNGVYYVRDLMNKRWKNRIDVLINPTDKNITLKKVKLYKL